MVQEGRGERHNGIEVQLGKLLYSVNVDGVRDRDLAVDLLGKAAATGDNDAKIALGCAVSSGGGRVRAILPERSC